MKKDFTISEVMELNGMLTDSIIEIEEEENIWDSRILSLFEKISERFSQKLNKKIGDKK